MYGRRSGEMENEQQQSSATTVCRAGCGFYGSSATDGLCSKCFKDQLQRTQEPVRLASPALSSSMAPTSSSTTNVDTSDLHSCAKEALAKSDVTRKMESQEAANIIAPPTPETKLLESAPVTPLADAPAPAKKANRCLTCKKRVGLTGFNCRCGGLYCGEHRYDQAHNCQFDYKTMERETIRKNNPVVVSDKVQRI